MNLKEVLKMADDIVFAKTGEHLDDLQAAILRGSIQGENYTQIAKESHRNKSYVRDVGSKLWQILSEELGEEVNKSNFRSAMERVQNSNVLNFAQNVSGSFNICGKTSHSPNIPNSDPPNQETSNQQKKPTLHHDLSEMPNLGTFYNRDTELQTLQTWILQENSRLITINGISGIGKTALATQLVQQIKNELKYVIWRSLETSSTFPELQTNLIELFLQTTNSKPLTLIKYLQNYRCLIILDDTQNIFASGQLAGQYKPGCEEYRTFFKQIKDLPHQSCILLIGWEAPQEIAQINNKNTPIHTLTLTGLNTTAIREILKEQGLELQDNYSALINPYQGNPLWLKSVANIILELEINVTDLLQNDTILLPENVKNILRQQCDRLSDTEKNILSILARETQPLKLAKLMEQQPTLNLELVNVLHSLQRRCLVEKIERGFCLLPLIKQYLATEKIW